MELDVLHLLDGATRLRMGQLPHLEFMTPLGILAFAPFSVFLFLGAGTAFVVGQAVVALALTPLLAWAGATRMRWPMAFIFAAVMLLIALSPNEGSRLPSMTFAAAYNRWSIVVACIVVVAALVPVPTRNQWIDGLVLGLGLSILALLKVTFFIAVFPGVLIALLGGRRWRALAATLATGLAVAVAVTLWAGAGFWSAYASDLRFFASLDLRGKEQPFLGYLAQGPIIASIALSVLIVPF
ncbi:MAG TPA: hypothetical protein VLA51_13355, partial [Paracoccaceae bacterium]|nr:hypothetical protein [Paracoccaceae bacterium]